MARYLRQLIRSTPTHKPLRLLEPMPSQVSTVLEDIRLLTYKVYPNQAGTLLLELPRMVSLTWDQTMVVLVSYPERVRVKGSPSTTVTARKQSTGTSARSAISNQ